MYTAYTRTGAAEEGGGVVEVFQVGVLQEPGQHHADAAADEADHEGACVCVVYVYVCICVC